jgi:ABC-2 type transport system permease protein
MNGRRSPPAGDAEGPRRSASAAARRRTRIVGLIRKETLQIVRDPSSISIAFALPVFLLLLFGYGISLDAKRVPVAVVVESPTQQTASFTASLANSQYFKTTVMRQRQVAERSLFRGDVDAIVVLQENFARQIWSNRAAPIQVIVNGTDANTARLIAGYLDGAWRSWLEQYALDVRRPITTAVAAEPRIWFNPEVRSRNFLVPGLIAIIMTLIGTLLTALVVAREWERGTMEALMVTPLRIGEILVGKLVPYFILGMGGMGLSTAMAIWLFDVPFRGSLLVLFAVSAIFMFAALGMGLLISTIAKNQFVAGQVAIIVAFLPAFILSGFIFDIASMPWFVRLITHVIPARYFVSSLQTLFLAGTVWPIVLTNGAALCVMAILFLGLTRRITRKSLE